MSKGLRYRADNDPRAASLLALSGVMSGEDSQAALDKVLAGASLVPSDKALATELFYGTLRYHLRLEWFLRQKLSRPEGLPGEMLLLLEQSMYELAHTRIPAHAGVNWAVGLVRARFGQGLAKVANGVLRGFERSKKDEYLNRGWYAGVLASGQKTKETAADELDALWFSLPRWLVRLWSGSYSTETCKALLEAALEAAPQGLRLNMRQNDTQEVIDLISEHGAKKLPPAAWILPDKVRLPVSAWLKNGLASRQSPAAYAALFALAPETWPQPLWDACAGRGGKTLALLERGLAVQTAGDPSKGRIRGLQEEYARLKLTEPPLPELLNTTAQQAGLTEAFRTVLVDAPCSGLGTLSHRPEIRWRRSEDDIARLAATQAEILEAAHRALIPESGSLIVYMTCTMTKTENQEQAAAFLARHPEYRLAVEYESPVENAPASEAAVEPASGLVNAPLGAPASAAQARPQISHGEFFYAALLKRT